MNYKEFVKANYDSVRHLPFDKRIGEIAKMWNAQKGMPAKKQKPTKKRQEEKTMKNDKKDNVEGEGFIDDIGRWLFKNLHPMGRFIEYTKDAHKKKQSHGGMLEKKPKEKPSKAKRMNNKEMMKLLSKQVKRAKGGDLGAPQATQASSNTPRTLPGFVQASGQRTKDQIIATKIQEQADEYAEKLKSSLYGQYAVPFIKPSEMSERGLPWFLAQHPNKYSANPNQVMLYRNSTQFLNSDFYNKYKANMQLVPERKGYGQSKARIIPGKPFRVVFRSMSADDNNQYYLDLPNGDAFMNLLDDAKESGKLIPTEFAAMQNIKNWQEQSNIRAKTNDIIWKTGFTKGQDELQPLIQEQQQQIANLQNQINQQQSSDSDSGFDWGSIASTAVGIISSIF